QYADKSQYQPAVLHFGVEIALLTSPPAEHFCRKFRLHRAESIILHSYKQLKREKSPTTQAYKINLHQLKTTLIIFNLTST
ncbi:MAG: hypothetical protein Q4G70_14070, partial [Pseudomonadota bacterium]|nr:hypothetical protein [Pseudomonadota bacterium]